MSKFIPVTLIFMAVTLATPAISTAATPEETPSPPDGAADAPPSAKTAGEVELGGIYLEGNTRSESLNAKLKASHDRGWATLGGEGSYYFTRNGEGEESTILSAQLSGLYPITDRFYFTLVAAYEQESKSGYDYRMWEIVSTGYRLVVSPPMSLTAELGSGVRHSLKRGGQERSDEPVGRGAIDVVWHFDNGAALEADIESIGGGDKGVVTTSSVAFSAPLYGGMGLKAGYLYKNNSAPPEGAEPTDIRVTLSLLFGF